MCSVAQSSQGTLSPCEEMLSMGQGLPMSPPPAPCRSADLTPLWSPLHRDSPPHVAASRYDMAQGTNREKNHSSFVHFLDITIRVLGAGAH